MPYFTDNPGFSTPKNTVTDPGQVFDPLFVNRRYKKGVFGPILDHKMGDSWPEGLIYKQRTRARAGPRARGRAPEWAPRPTRG